MTTDSGTPELAAQGTEGSPELDRATDHSGIEQP